MNLNQESSPEWLGKISHFLNSISSGILFILIILTVADVIFKKLFSERISGTLEISEFLIAAIAFFSLAESELKERNINVDSFVKRMSPLSRTIVEALVKFLGFLFYCFVTIGVFKYAGLVKSTGEVSSDLSLPLYPVAYIMALVLFLFNIVYLFRLITSIYEVWRSWIRL